MNICESNHREWTAAGLGCQQSQMSRSNAKYRRIQRSSMGLGAPEEHSQSAHAVVAQLRSVRSDNLGGRHCAPKSKTLNYWQDGKSVCTLITKKESPQVWGPKITVRLGDNSFGPTLVHGRRCIHKQHTLGGSAGMDRVLPWALAIECSYTLWWLSRSLPCG